jgi:hypothetical protein
MATFEELDELSSQELHDRAMQRARRHLDVRFLWRVVEMTPAAEVASGELEEAELDAERSSAQLADALRADHDGELLDSLRPVYIDYLLKHGDG